MRPFPTKGGDRRSGCCQATGGIGWGSGAAGPGPGLFAGVLCPGFFPRLFARALGGLGSGRGQQGYVEGRHRRLRVAGERRRLGQGQGKADAGERGLRAGYCHWEYVIRCYRQHTHKNPCCFLNGSRQEVALGEDTRSCSPYTGWEQPGCPVPDSRGKQQPSHQQVPREAPKARDEPWLLVVCGPGSGIWRYWCISSWVYNL